jgi:hypothetical protein
MTTSFDDPRAFNKLSFAEKAEILRFKKNIDHIAVNISKMEKIISSGPFKKPKFKKEEEVPCLTYSLAPNIPVEFNANLGKTMAIPKIVDHYVQWSNKSLEVFQSNKDVLWNTKVFDHCLALLNLCLTAKATLQKANIDWPEIDEKD